MKKIYTPVILSILFVVVLFGIWFYFLEKGRIVKFDERPITPTSYRYPEINSVKDLENAFKDLSLEKVPFNIKGSKEYNIVYKDIKELFPNISKNIKSDREIELYVDVVEYVPGSRIWMEGSDVGSYDSCKKWLQNLKVGPYKENLKPNEGCLDTTDSDYERVKKINSNIYYVNDTTNLHLEKYWTRNYQTYNLKNNTIINVIINYGEQNIDPKELQNIQNIFLEIEKLLP